jgi:hypothetical protein
VFADFSSAADVEAVFDAARRAWRSTLIVWEYALLRSERHGLARPVAADLYFVTRRFNGVRPWLVAASGVAAVLSIGVFGVGGFALSIMNRIWVLVIVFGIFLAFMIPFAISQVRALLGPNGRAMRLVWQARSAEPAQRLRLLEEAVGLDPELGKARTDGSG